MAKKKTRTAEFNQCRNDVAFGIREAAAEWLRDHGRGGQHPPLMASFKLAEQYCRKTIKSSRAKR